VQEWLTVIAMQRRIEEERRREAWATTGYPYAYRKAGETTQKAHTQKTMGVRALASAAGNGGAKRKRWEKDVGEGFAV